MKNPIILVHTLLPEEQKTIIKYAYSFYDQLITNDVFFINSHSYEKISLSKQNFIDWFLLGFPVNFYVQYKKYPLQISIGKSDALSGTIFFTCLPPVYLKSSICDPKPSLDIGFYAKIILKIVSIYPIAYLETKKFDIK